MGRSIAAIAVPLALLVAGSAGCKGGSGPANDGFDRKALLRQLGEGVILPAYRDFSTAAAALQTAAQASAAAPGSAAELAAARAAWKAAMAAWQRADVFQVGPAGAPPARVGAKGLRDRIYSWPTVNTCRVDQEVVAEGYKAADFFQTALVNAYGLAALEYLLFNESADNSCPPQATINSSGQWAALSAAGRTSRRAAYAEAAARFLAATAQALVTDWEPSGGNFLGQLVSAGEAGSIYPSAQAALDEVFAALFYVDLRTKDRKLADPLGYTTRCTAPPCPLLAESRFARHSKENIAANLRTLQAALLGGAPGAGTAIGFDDFLVHRNAKGLADSLAADVTAAIAATEGIPGALEDAVVNDRAKVEAAYDAVKKVTDTLKSQFVTVLNLKVPSEGASDND